MIVRQPVWNLGSTGHRPFTRLCTGDPLDTYIAGRMRVLARLLRPAARLDGRFDLTASLGSHFSTGDDQSSRDPAPSRPGSQQGPRKDMAEERLSSGSQASTSAPNSSPSVSSSLRGRPRTGDPPTRPQAPQSTGRSQDNTLGQPQSTLDAKKAYRQEQLQRRRELQQRVASEQAATSATLARKQDARRAALEEFRAAEEAPRKALLAEKTLREELSEEDLNKYVGLDKDLLPEVFATKAVSSLEQMHPKGGCPGLQDELAATRSDTVLHRKCIQELVRAVASKSQQQIYLIGAPASGKSIALAAVVNTLRAQGWLVMYVPQAKQLTHGGFFFQNDDNTWDTAECAKLMMHYLLAGNPSHADRVTSPSSGQTLRELVEAALANTEAKEVVDAFLEVKMTVANAENAVIVIDNYQALYAPTEYGEWMNQHHRRVIQPEELRIASAMRVLEQPPLRDGVVICAANRGGSYSPKLKMPIPKNALRTIPRMDRQEWQAMAEFYQVQGTTDEVSPENVEKMFFLTGGNPKEYRLFADSFALQAAII